MKKTAQLIDDEVNRIVQECYRRARELIQSRLDTLRLIAETLLEHEVLEGSQIDMLMRGERVPKVVRTPKPEASGDGSKDDGKVEEAPTA